MVCQEGEFRRKYIPSTSPEGKYTRPYQSESTHYHHPYRRLHTSKIDSPSALPDFPVPRIVRGPRQRNLPEPLNQLPQRGGFSAKHPAKGLGGVGVRYGAV
jgi:hypothetical protein